LVQSFHYFGGLHFPQWFDYLNIFVVLQKQICGYDVQFETFVFGTFQMSLRGTDMCPTKKSEVGRSSCLGCLRVPGSGVQVLAALRK